MPRAPRVTGAEVLSALQKAGWYIVDTEGSHVQLKHSTRPGKVTVPVRRGKTMKMDTLGSVLRQAGLTMAEFRKLL